MVRTLSSNQAKQQWGSIMSSVGNDGDAVIVESHGKPKVVVVSYNQFQEFDKERTQRQRAKAVAEFDLLSARIGNHNRDLSPEQIDELANRFAHEMYEDLERAGSITFSRQAAEESTSYKG